MTCDETLRDKVRHHLEAFEPHIANVDDAHHAAVAVTITDTGYGADLPGLPRHRERRPDASLILTRRSTELKRHSGQWAFPGGRLEPGETPSVAARREMHEEIAVELGEDAVLGRLDDFVTRSGFVITPIVVWGGPRLEMVPNPDEVASIHRIPLSEFMRDDSPRFDNSPHSEHPVLLMPIGDDYIAAPTAALIYQFREVCLLGRDTRVGHYEQPEFAWR